VLIRRIDWRPLVVCAFVLQGCASPAAPSLASRFVRPGEPSIEYGADGARPVGEKADRRHAEATKPPAQAGGYACSGGCSGGPSGPQSEGRPDQRSRSQDAHADKAADPARSAHIESGVTVEGTDQRLSTALLVEAMTPSVDSHLLVAREYVRLRIYDAARKRIERAIALDPKRADAHEALARLWRDWGSPDLALGPAYRAIGLSHRSASSLNTLGTILGALDQWPAAASRFAEAATRAPDAAWAHSNWCYAEFRMARFASARAQCSKALELDAASRAAHNNLGLVLAAEGDVEGAQAEFRAGGDEAAAEYNTGIVRAAMSDYDGAADAFDRALDANPDFVAAMARARQARLNALHQRDAQKPSHAPKP
jgi:Tfp pilus assembly protein PilF